MNVELSLSLLSLALSLSFRLVLHGRLLLSGNFIRRVGCCSGDGVVADDFKVSSFAVYGHPEQYGPKPAENERRRVKLNHSVNKGAPVTFSALFVAHRVHARIRA